MKTIGIIGAMEEEILCLKEKIEIITIKKVVGLSYYIGRFNGNNIVLVRSGIGKVNAAICAQAMIDHFGVDYILVLGVAGALISDLKIGDIVISTDAVQHDMDTSVLGDPVGTIPRMAESYFKADEELISLAKKAAEEIPHDYQIMTGRIASGDQFVSTKEGKAKIRKDVQGVCAEMEGAAIAHACWLNNIPYLVVRAISDGAGEDANISFEKFCTMAAKRCSDLVEKVLEKM
ncbi:MAG: 5'-methylthioadenosine/adenosylhomocysteine nucleosidase [Anaerotignum sp.]